MSTNSLDLNFNFPVEEESFIAQKRLIWALENYGPGPVGSADCLGMIWAYNYGDFRN